jgi:hypothetical protein
MQAKKNVVNLENRRKDEDDQVLLCRAIRGPTERRSDSDLSMHYYKGRNTAFLFSDVQKQPYRHHLDDTRATPLAT